MSCQVIEAQDAVAQLTGWEISRGGKAISKSFTFDDFARAIAFMTYVGIHADKMDHHPEWSNVYNRVSVELTTHDFGTVTTRDLALAKIMDEA